MTDEIDAARGQRTATKPKRWLWVTAVIAGLAPVGVGVAALFGAFVTESEPPASSPTQLTSPAPTSNPTPTPTLTPTPAPDPAVNIESVEHMPYSEVWNPPDEGEHFWQIVDPENGYPETGGTPFVLAHACENQQCAGDEIGKLTAGDTFTFLGETYEVDDSRSIMKKEIQDQDIWYHDPNRIVVITCIIETTWQESDKNHLVLASRI